MATQFASRLGLISFATASLWGLYCGADFFGTMETALIALGAFYVLGFLVGEVARRIVEENVKSELVQRLESAHRTETHAQTS